ncbi:putative phage tail protein [Pseudomonas sp. Pse1]|uniref:putative phage tail protein n=1 Tax=Pseudomonas sp. Pse1 TaxID=2926020 RepID=UPI0021198913|nr:putative phage tail protein [Pseudomonas sp. Pse1]
MVLTETEADYFQQMRQLLPPGPAFDLEQQPDIAQLLAALAPELARVDGNGEALLLELNPATATVLLPVWEGYLGLPDLCVVPGTQPLEERRAAVIDKLTGTGAPQLGYYRKLGRQSGVPLVIEEFRPARVGSTNAGDFLYGDGWPWGWFASVPLEAYGSDEAAALDCRLQRDAPQYTDVVMAYGRSQVDSIALKVDELFTAIHYTLPATIAGNEEL